MIIGIEEEVMEQFRVVQGTGWKVEKYNVCGNVLNETLEYDQADSAQHFIDFHQQDL